VHDDGPWIYDMSNGDRPMVVGRQNMPPNDAHFELLDGDESKKKVENDLKQPTGPVEASDKTGLTSMNASKFTQSSQITKEKAGNGLTHSIHKNLKAQLGLVIPWCSTQATSLHSRTRV
jgi:hypothetical protein